MRRIEILKNVSSSWFGLGVNILVGIFLSPFILHRLGDTAYGIWILIFSVTGYYGLFDLGIRSSVVRYVSTYTATDDQDGLARLINTSLATYATIGAVAMVVTLSCSVFVDRIFRIPADFLPTARLLFLMVGTAVALGFPTGVFGGILEGLQRFYFVNLTNVISTLLRAALIVFASAAWVRLVDDRADHCRSASYQLDGARHDCPASAADSIRLAIRRSLGLSRNRELQRGQFHPDDRLQAALQDRRDRDRHVSVGHGDYLFLDWRPAARLRRRTW